MRVEILQDITTRFQGTFFKRSAEIIYDARSPKKRKTHQLVFQQGSSFGNVGDKCEYLTHDELQDLVREGKVRIKR